MPTKITAEWWHKEEIFVGKKIEFSCGTNLERRSQHTHYNKSLSLTERVKLTDPAISLI